MDIPRTTSQGMCRPIFATVRSRPILHCCATPRSTLRIDLRRCHWRCATQNYCKGSVKLLTAHERPVVQATHVSVAAAALRRRLSRRCTAALEIPSTSVKLILYSKSDCPLCDGLQQKVQALLDQSLFEPSLLSNLPFEVLEVTQSEVLQRKYGAVVPCLVVCTDAGRNAVVPRLPPRTPTSRLRKAIVETIQLLCRSPEASTGANESISSAV